MDIEYNAKDKRVGIMFQNIHQALVYHKAYLFRKRELMLNILETTDETLLKTYSDSINSNNMKIVWEMVVGKYLKNILKAYIIQNEPIKQKLVETIGQTLVYTDNENAKWCVKVVENNYPKSRDDFNGKNIYGELLTLLRIELAGNY
jgi:predicted NAD-dependent protein-ADP-ribosyltransferase YbiA (DUF1768 family)